MGILKAMTVVVSVYKAFSLSPWGVRFNPSRSGSVVQAERTHAAKSAKRACLIGKRLSLFKRKVVLKFMY